MKSILINLGIFIGLFLMYYFDFWNLFTFHNALFYALGMVVIMLLIGLKVFGNPFGKRK